jgi:hypothetical protein
MEWRRTGLRLALDAVLAWVCVATQWTFSRMYIPQAVVPLVLFPVLYTTFHFISSNAAASFCAASVPMCSLDAS